MGHLRRGAAVLLLLVTALTVSATSAGADCSGPTISYEAGEVRRGQTITVNGSAWGDQCYDTGPPPAGEGVLGVPRGRIEVVIVQGAGEHVVARGAADDDYSFEVDVVVPTSLEPGEARVTARHPGGDAWDATDQPLLVTDEPPLDVAEDLVRFGPEDATAAAGTSEAPSEEGAVDATAMMSPAAAVRDRGGDVVVPFVLGLVSGGALVSVLLLLRPRSSVVVRTADPDGDR